MLHLKIYALLYLSVFVFAKRENGRGHKNVKDEPEENVYGKYRHSPTTTGKATNGEAVVEKFVDTLISGERYLKMIETVERKLNHLDGTFHERSNTITKYLTEIIRMIKSSPSEGLEDALKMLKFDLDKLKHTVIERLENKPNLRGK